jgi:hypothetical protein
MFWISDPECSRACRRDDSQGKETAGPAVDLQNRGVSHFVRQESRITHRFASTRYLEDCRSVDTSQPELSADHSRHDGLRRPETAAAIGMSPIIVPVGCYSRCVAGSTATTRTWHHLHTMHMVTVNP